MRIKHFRNDVTTKFSEIPGFKPKPKWQPPKDHPNLEVFLSQIEKKLSQLRLPHVIRTFLRKSGRE